MSKHFKIENTTVGYDFDLLETEQFVVKSVPYDYEIIFVNQEILINELGKITDLNASKHFLFIDKKVEELYGEGLFCNQEKMSLLAEEDNKTLPVATLLLDKLQEKNFTKRELFVSVGGGITQDLSAFARAVYKRGINWIYIPTTLLAMADSCIGAKSCLNYGNVKNQLGLFSAPKKVFINRSFLKSLGYRDVLSGFGEILKLAIVGGKDAIAQFKNLTAGQQDDLLFNIEKLIRLSLLIKKSVIEIDEFENNIRRALNYGHTIGHAIEPLVNYDIPHGVAVSIGMYIENLLAAKYGSLPQEDAENLNKIIIKFIDDESLTCLKDVLIADVINNMKRDKKVISDKLYLAVPFNIGYFDILKIKSDQSFEDFLSASINSLIRSK